MDVLAICLIGEIVGLLSCCCVTRCWYSSFVDVVRTLFMSWNLEFWSLLLPRIHGDGSGARS